MHLLHDPASWLAGKTLCGAKGTATYVAYDPGRPLEEPVEAQLPDGVCQMCAGRWVSGWDMEAETDADAAKRAEISHAIHRLEKDLGTTGIEGKPGSWSGMAFLRALATILQVSLWALRLEKDLTIRLDCQHIPLEQQDRVKSTLDGFETALQQAVFDYQAEQRRELMEELDFQMAVRDPSLGVTSVTATEVRHG